VKSIRKDELRLELPLRLADLNPDHVGADQADHGDQGKEDHEAVAAEVIGQLLFADGGECCHGYASRKYFM
jgi:hypothetical protein